MREFFGVLLGEDEPALPDFEVLAWRNDVDGVFVDALPVAGNRDRHLGVPGQQAVHHCLVVGREVLDDDECCAGGVCDTGEESFEGFESARGGADADEDRGGLAGGQGGVAFALRSQGRIAQLLPRDQMAMPTAAEAIGVEGSRRVVRERTHSRRFRHAYRPTCASRRRV